jgi:prephenate dehydrogenase
MREVGGSAGVPAEGLALADDSLPLVTRVDTPSRSTSRVAHPAPSVADVMNNQPEKLVEQLEAAKATLRALEEALDRTKKLIEKTRKIIDQAKADHGPPPKDASP